MASCFALPVRHRSLIEPEGLDNGLGGASKGKECPDQHDGLLVGFEMVEGSSLSPGEGLMAGRASPPIAKAVMDFEVASALDTS